MRSTYLAAPLAGALLAALVSLPAQAQTRVVIGVETGRPVYRAPVVIAPPPRVIVVEPDPWAVQYRHFHRGRGWWKNHGYRQATLYYDNDRYYDRWIPNRPGLRAVVVYERDGRYWRPDDDGYSTYDRGGDGYRGRSVYQERQYNRDWRHHDRDDD